MKRTVIFGTGKLYEKWKTKLRKDVHVIAFLDNSPQKIGKELDGKPILMPSELTELSYDCILILSAYVDEMRKQLCDLGISAQKVYDLEQIEHFCDYAEYETFLPIANQGTAGRKMLIFSHALTSTGAQNALYLFAKILLEYGFQVQIVSKNDGVLRPQFVDIGIPVTIMKDYRMAHPKMQQLVSWADEVIINTLWLYTLIYELSNQQKKIHWWIHEYGPVEFLLKQDFYELVKNEFVVTYAVSPLLIHSLERYGGCYGRIKSFMFGIEEYSIDKPVGRRERVTFSIIGYIGPVKGHDIFLRAIDALPQRYLECARFLIAGAGELDEDEKEIVARHSEIEVLGELPHDNMQDLYRQTDVVVACSREDSMSIVTLEGFMNRIPAIVSDAMGVADFIHNKEDSFIVPTENVAAFCEKMMWMIDHPEERVEMGKKARKIYDTYFSMKCFRERIKEVFGL